MVPARTPIGMHPSNAGTDKNTNKSKQRCIAISPFRHAVGRARSRTRTGTPELPDEGF